MPLSRRSLLAAPLLLLLPRPARAAPVRYRLDPARSTVGFTYRFQGRPVAGSMPVLGADITIDFDDVRATAATVSLDAAHARAGFVFATEAMRGPAVLDAARHPTIRFVSTAVAPSGTGATMRGALTVRGVTRPVALSARFARAPGADPASRAALTVALSGRISRAAFGATGYPEFVDDPIDLDILAGIARVG